MSADTLLAMSAVLRGKARGLALLGAAAILVTAIAVALLSRSAHAAFPGRNGLIAFAGYAAGDGEIYTVHKDGSHQRQLTHNAAEDTGPAFSPNGRKIVYVHDVDPTPGGHYELFAMKPDGSHKHQLTHTDDGAYDPAFSPNGKKIAFTTGQGTGIFTVNSDGTHEHQVTDAPDDLNPSFAPNGRHIVFVHYVGVTPEIFTMRPDGSHLRRLTHNDQSDTNPSYSPDGKKIVWSGYRGRPEDILVMNADGTHQRNLTKNALYEFDPVFSPDGTKIAFYSSPGSPGKRGAGGNDAEIFVMHRDGSHRHALTHNETFDQSPDWQPKHRRR
jgi:Tol biopolymer transport system component